jgi:hypothetical protein
MATQTTCGTWVMSPSNATCLNCLAPLNDAGTSNGSGGLLLDYTGTAFLGANTPGCIALADPTNGPACAASLEPLLQCETQACNTAACNMGNATAYDNCISESQMGACATQYASSADCAPDYADGGAATTKCATDPDILDVICGSGP